MTAADILRMIEHHGNAVWDERTQEYKTLNEHWIVNGYRFNHDPTKKEIDAAFEHERGGK